MNPFWGWSALAYKMPLDQIAKHTPHGSAKNIEPLATELAGMIFEKTNQ